MATGQPATYEEQMLDSDGLPRDVIIRLVPYTDTSGAVAGVIACLMDVTEFRETAQRTLEAKEAANRANTAKSEFLANISHELRTPLQSILGFSELGMVRSSDQPGLNDMLTNIHTGSRRMLQVVDDLLDLSQLKSAAGTLHFATTDTRALIEEVINHTDEEARRRDIRIDLHPATTDTVAEVSALRLQQAFRTVIERAIRVSPDHSRIEIRSSHDGAGTLHWWIHDAGSSIPESDGERQFSAFNQASHAHARIEEQGSGLELAICREILRSHGGNVQCTSSPGVGNIFHLFLPATRNMTMPTDGAVMNQQKNLANPLA